MLAVLVELETHGPMSFSYPLVALSPPTYPLPPQSTIVGALAYSVLKNEAQEDQAIDGKMYSSVASIVNKVRYATAGCKGYVILRTLERIFQVPYLSHIDQWKNKNLFFTVGQRGVVSYLDNTLYLFMIIDNELLKYVWGITRLGRKENIVSVRNVLTAKISNEAFEAKTHAEEVVDTIFYVPKGVVKSCESAEVYSMPIIDRENYTFTTKPKTVEFYIPVTQLNGHGDMLAVMRCTVQKDKAMILEFRGMKIIVDKGALYGHEENK